MNAVRAAYQLTFQLSPIILTGGTAKFIPGGMLPLISITESLNFVTGLLSGAAINLDSFFANFEPLPGSSLIDLDFSRYPFANQAVAANAIISNPLKVSLIMHCPARGRAGYAAKLATMMALQATIANHTSNGGTFTVATPVMFYDNCLLKGLTEMPSANSKQWCSTYRWDFERPLLTQADGAQAQNNLMGKITAGVSLPGNPPPWSGLNPTVGAPPSLAGPAVVPAMSNVGGAGVSAPSVIGSRGGL